MTEEELARAYGFKDWIASTDQKLRLRIVVPGRPTSWQRARKQGKRHFNEGKLESMENAIAGATMAAMSKQGFKRIPRGRQAGVNMIISTDTSGGDVDRYVNAVLDGLSKGGLYDDDRQVMGDCCLQVSYYTKAHGVLPVDAALAIEAWDNGELGE